MGHAESTVLGNSGNIRPVDSLLLNARNASRRIESTPWFRQAHIDFDIPADGLQNPALEELKNRLTATIQDQGHFEPGRPNTGSDMIVGFCDIPNDGRPLLERIPEVNPPMVLEAGKKYNTNALRQNYVAVVQIPENLGQIGKREMETITRVMMSRLGALKIIIMDPEHYIFATMEGGKGVEKQDDPYAIEKLRDRMVTHALSKDAGQFQPVKDVIAEEIWRASPSPQYLVDLFTRMGEWNYIDKPFEIGQYVSKQRLDLIQRIMGYSRQSESAGAVWAPDIIVPPQYRMGRATGTLITTGSGRFNINKREMDPNRDIVSVAIVPKEGHEPTAEDPLDLYSFDRYALGRIGQDGVIGPSIEFDEMAAVFRGSPLVRVSKHPHGEGFIRDPHGDILIPRVMGFIHLHDGIEEIDNKQYNGTNTTSLIEYIPANLEDFPYPTGCGRDTTFASSTDSARRSMGVMNTESGIAVAFFDTLDHGTNALILAQEKPGTDVIPDNSLQIFTDLIDPKNGIVQFTEEVAMV